MREKNLLQERSFRGGVQRLYKFPNGYGASVVRHEGSYGHEAGKWELAVIKFDADGANWDLCYTTPVTDDVVGWLSDDAVDEVLVDIEAL